MLANTTMLKFALLALALSACGEIPKPADVRAASEDADQICALGQLLPESDERATLLDLCDRHASAKELAAAYAQAAK